MSFFSCVLERSRWVLSSAGGQGFELGALRVINVVFLDVCFHCNGIVLYLKPWLRMRSPRYFVGSEKGRKGREASQPFQHYS
jgi:hypothetical protein